MFVADRETGFIKGYRTVPDQGVGSEAKYGITTLVIIQCVYGGVNLLLKNTVCLSSTEICDGECLDSEPSEEAANHYTGCGQETVRWAEFRMSTLSDKLPLLLMFNVVAYTCIFKLTIILDLLSILLQNKFTLKVVS